MAKRVNLVAPINNLGYGLFALGYARELAKFDDIDLHIYPIHNHIEQSLFKIFDIRKWIDAHAIISDSDTINFLIWHESGHFLDGKQILSTHFEVTPPPNFHNTEPGRLITKIGVSSAWAAKALWDSGFVEAQVCHGPVLPIGLYVEDLKNNLKEKVISLAGMDKNTIVFSSSGKFEKRKGHHRLIAAIDETQLPILLITTWQNPFVPDAGHHYLISQNWKFVGDATYLDGRVSVFTNDYGAKIICFPKITNYTEVLDIYAIADAHLAISAGEGWDMPAIEHMALGVPTILSENTAHLEYIPRSDPHFVLPCGPEEARDSVFFVNPGRYWQPVDQNSLVQCLGTLSVKPRAYYQSLSSRYSDMAHRIHEGLPSHLRSLLDL